MTNSVASMWALKKAFNVSGNCLIVFVVVAIEQHGWSGEISFDRMSILPKFFMAVCDT